MDRVIEGKLRPPDAPRGVVPRPRVRDLLERDARVRLLIAPPGFGKTVAVREWVDGAAVPVAWLSVDLLDTNPLSFWAHLVAALRTVLPGIDDEPEIALAENPRSDHFLSVLIAQIERSPSQAVVVVDDLARLDDPALFAGLALIVERVGERLGLCATCRSEPPLPLARWRAAGWLVEVDEDDLRLRAEEAHAIAATFDGLHVGTDEVARLNDHVGGWPIAFQLALVARSESASRDVPEPGADGADRLLADFLVGEILDQLPPAEREAALVLSVVDRFDADLARDLAGPAVGVALAGLSRRRLVGPVVGAPAGTLGFHRLLRDLLDRELRWRDPSRHRALHRQAARLAVERGDLNAAYQHLTTIGDTAAANALIVDPVLALVDAGDLAGVSRVIGSLPVSMSVRDPALALDLAIAWFFAGSIAQATTWLERAEGLGAARVPTTAMRLAMVRCIVAQARGDLAAAAVHLDAVEALVPSGAGSGPIERRFPAYGTRVALARRDTDGARRWLDRMTAFGSSGSTAAALSDELLHATLDVLAGRLLDADAAVRRICAAIDEQELRPHGVALDALVVAAWCRYGLGDLAGADEFASAARVEAAVVGTDADRARAGGIAAEVRLLLDGPDAALSLVRDVRVHLDRASVDAALELDRVAAKALLRAGRLRAASERLAALPPGPRVRLLQASIAITTGRADLVGSLLIDSDGWHLVERVEAALLRAVADPSARPGLVAALEDAAATGWVAPFLGHPAKVEALLLEQPLERLHPRLLDRLRATRRPPVAEVIDLVDPITGREQTILELLPSHLSYAQIGERLFLSVNTVKSNLKSIYRKLGVTTRADAVEAARAAGLI